jgi:hypothetical protein
MVGGRLRTSFVCASVGVGIRLKGWSAHTFAMRARILRKLWVSEFRFWVLENESMVQNQEHEKDLFLKVVRHGEL